MVTYSRKDTTPITDTFGDRLTHHAADEQLAPRTAGLPLRALCGRVIVAAPLASPTGAPCPVCAIDLSRLRPTHSEPVSNIDGKRFRVRWLLRSLFPHPTA